METETDMFQSHIPAKWFMRLPAAKRVINHYSIPLGGMTTTSDSFSVVCLTDPKRDPNSYTKYTEVFVPWVDIKVIYLFSLPPVKTAREKCPFNSNLLKGSFLATRRHHPVANNQLYWIITFLNRIGLEKRLYSNMQP